MGEQLHGGFKLIFCDFSLAPNEYAFNEESQIKNGVLAKSKLNAWLRKFFLQTVSPHVESC